MKEYDCAIAGNKMICIRESGADVLYSFGGANSDGCSYKLKLTANPDWVSLEK